MSACWICYSCEASNPPNDVTCEVCDAPASLRPVPAWADPLDAATSRTEPRLLSFGEFLGELFDPTAYRSVVQDVVAFLRRLFEW